MDESLPTVGVFASIFDEQQRILCVKRGYGPRNWTMPGGGIEPGETPIQALEREVREETGYLVSVEHLIGIYSAPFKDDLVLLFAATPHGRETWEPDGEIVEVAFFRVNDLPEPMGKRAIIRVQDAFAGHRGIVRVFDSD